jgi:3'(2'), 5'-bisphosphate nucleotidase
MSVVSNVDPILKLAIAAGKAILTVYNDPKEDFDISIKADNSPLTKADKVAHKIIAKGLQSLYPEIPLISEEGRNILFEERRGWTRFWCVDPLDGTKEFIKRNGEFTVNIALIEQGLPVFGVIYAPVQDVLYFGDHKRGSWKQVPGQKAVPLRSNVKTGNWTAVGSRSHAETAESEILAQYPVDNFIAIGSSLKFCMLAEGKAQIYLRKGPTMEWDTAAGQAIACFSGCSVETLEGKPMVYNKQSLVNSGFLCKAIQN